MVCNARPRSLAKAHAKHVWRDGSATQNGLSWCVRSDSLWRKECNIYLLAKCCKLWIGKARDFVPQEDGSAMCGAWMQIYKSKTHLHWQAKMLCALEDCSWNHAISCTDVQERGRPDCCANKSTEKYADEICQAYSKPGHEISQSRSAERLF